MGERDGDIRGLSRKQLVQDGSVKWATRHTQGFAITIAIATTYNTILITIDMNDIYIYIYVCVCVRVHVCRCIYVYTQVPSSG